MTFVLVTKIQNILSYLYKRLINHKTSITSIMYAIFLSLNLSSVIFCYSAISRAAVCIAESTNNLEERLSHIKLFNRKPRNSIEYSLFYYKLNNFRFMVTLSGNYSSFITDELKADCDSVEQIFIDRIVNIMSRYSFSLNKLKAIVITSLNNVKHNGVGKLIFCFPQCEIFYRTESSITIEGILQTICKYIEMDDFRGAGLEIQRNRIYIDHISLKNKDIKDDIKVAINTAENYIFILEIFDELQRR